MAHVYLETQRCADKKSIDTSLQKIATQAKHLDLQTNDPLIFATDIYAYTVFFTKKKINHYNSIFFGYNKVIKQNSIFYPSLKCLMDGQNRMQEQSFSDERAWIAIDRIIQQEKEEKNKAIAECMKLIQQNAEQKEE